MSDLADFLLARIAEDEERARARMRKAQDNRLTLKDLRFLGREIPGWWEWPEIEALAAHVLAECESKRVIVELHKPHKRIYGLGCEVCLQPRHLPADAPGWPCETLRLLAVSYSSHPDYRAEWLPAGWSVEKRQMGSEASASWNG